MTAVARRANPSSYQMLQFMMLYLWFLRLLEPDEGDRGDHACPLEQLFALIRHEVGGDDGRSRSQHPKRPVPDALALAEEECEAFNRPATTDKSGAACRHEVRRDQRTESAQEADDVRAIAAHELGRPSGQRDVHGGLARLAIA